MGTLQCEREGCGNILCRRVIHVDLQDDRYICDQCFADLWREQALWPERMTPSEMKQRLRRFFANPIDEPEDREDMFKSLCRCA
jgi:hypothetical protein